MIIEREVVIIKPLHGCNVGDVPLAHIINTHYGRLFLAKQIGGAGWNELRESRG